MRKVQRTAWERARSGGGASSDGLRAGDTAIVTADTWTFGTAALGRLGGTTDSDAGEGLAGDNWQQLWALVWLSITAVCPAADFAIIGQCGRQCSGPLLRPFQQRLMAAAGPANSPNNKSKATSLDGIFTSGTVLKDYRCKTRMHVIQITSSGEIRHDLVCIQPA